MIKKIFKKILLREKASSEQFVKYLRKRGVQVGENVHFFSPPHTHVDMTCPWLLSIGNNVSVTHGVIILTHDYAWSVIKQLQDEPGAILGAQSPVKIGNNVFIGMNAVITRGVTVGDNVIIGAGSVVTGDCESNSVYAGNPARRIMTLEQYRQKRRDQQQAEAKTFVQTYRQRFGANPPKELLTEYFMLFCTAQEAEKIPAFRAQLETGGNLEDSVAYMHKHPPVFESYEAFLEACGN